MLWGAGRRWGGGGTSDSGGRRGDSRGQAFSPAGGLPQGRAHLTLAGQHAFLSGGDGGMAVSVGLPGPSHAGARLCSASPSYVWSRVALHAGSPRGPSPPSCRQTCSSSFKTELRRGSPGRSVPGSPLPRPRAGEGSGRELVLPETRSPAHATWVDLHGSPLTRCRHLVLDSGTSHAPGEGQSPEADPGAPEASRVPVSPCHTLLSLGVSKGSHHCRVNS